MNDLKILLSEELVINKIYRIRNKQVMLDSDLSELYGVPTKVLKQQVKRNSERFPDDFMFELSREEFYNLRSQIVTSSWGGSRYLPKVFTEQGVAMLSSVLNSRQSILVNIQIIRVFTKMRELLSSHKEIIEKLEHLGRKEMEQDKSIAAIFRYLKELEKAKELEKENNTRIKIGFTSSR